MNQKTILVCDDDQSILEVIQIILEENGYIVKTKTNGKGIQKSISQIKPDLILLDLWMPGIDGKEITKIVKKDGLHSSIPIIIISALNNTQKISQEIGADGFIPKPFDISSLLSTVKKFTS